MADRPEPSLAAAVTLECGCVPIMRLGPTDVPLRAVCATHGDRVVVQVVRPLEYEL